MWLDLFAKVLLIYLKHGGERKLGRLKKRKKESYRLIHVSNVGPAPGTALRSPTKMAESKQPGHHGTTWAWYHMGIIPQGHRATWGGTTAPAPSN